MSAKHRSACLLVLMLVATHAHADPLPRPTKAMSAKQLCEYMSAGVEYNLRSQAESLLDFKADGTVALLDVMEGDDPIAMTNAAAALARRYYAVVSNPKPADAIEIKKRLPPLLCKVIDRMLVEPSDPKVSRPELSPLFRICNYDDVPMTHLMQIVRKTQKTDKPKFTRTLFYLIKNNEQADMASDLILDAFSGVNRDRDAPGDAARLCERLDRSKELLQALDTAPPEAVSRTVAQISTKQLGREGPVQEKVVGLLKTNQGIAVRKAVLQRVRAIPSLVERVGCEHLLTAQSATEARELASALSPSEKEVPWLADHLMSTSGYSQHAVLLALGSHHGLQQSPRFPGKDIASLIDSPTPETAAHVRVMLRNWRYQSVHASLAGYEPGTDEPKSRASVSAAEWASRPPTGRTALPLPLEAGNAVVVSTSESSFAAIIATVTLTIGIYITFAAVWVIRTVGSREIEHPLARDAVS